MSTKPLYILIKLDVDGHIVNHNNVETYVKNHCDALEYEWKDYMLEDYENPFVYIAGREDKKWSLISL